MTDHTTPTGAGYSPLRQLLYRGSVRLVNVFAVLSQKFRNKRNIFLKNRPAILQAPRQSEPVIRKEVPGAAVRSQKDRQLLAPRLPGQQHRLTDELDAKAPLAAVPRIQAREIHPGSGPICTRPTGSSPR